MQLCDDWTGYKFSLRVENAFVEVFTKEIRHLYGSTI